LSRELLTVILVGVCFKINNICALKCTWQLLADLVDWTDT
jgi:hypothetical protein